MTEINLFPKFVDEAMSPVAGAVGNTLTSVWEIVFGRMDFYAQKTQLKRAESFKKFKQELEDGVNSVPPEKLVEPPLHIVGPTIEASKFYFENSELRSMFSNLIIASINEDTISMTHPSFVEIIKQLSPLDAKNLKLFKSKRDIYPIVDYVFRLKSRGFKVIQSNVFLGDTSSPDIYLNSASITNLSRLGLVTISNTQHLTDDKQYDEFFKTPVYQEQVAILNSIQDACVTPGTPLYQVNHPLLSVEKVDLQKGSVSLTPYGKNFIEICVSE